MLTRQTARRLLIAGILPALIAAYYAIAVPGTPPAHAGAQNDATQNIAAATQQILPDFTRIVEQNGPAVVNVSVSHKALAGVQTPFQGIPEDDPMFEFFRRFAPPSSKGATDATRPVRFHRDCRRGHPHQRSRGCRRR